MAAIDDARPKKTNKTERAEKRQTQREAKREAKRRKMMDDARGVPEEVVSAVRATKNARRFSQDVPDEVVAAVEEAAARERGGNTFGRDRRGRVVYIERGW